jgi:hypothetical protein
MNKEDVQKKIDELFITCYDHINDDEIEHDLRCSIGYGLLNFKIRFDHLALFSRLL